MPHPRQLLPFLFSRHMLWGLAVVVGAVLVWFGGPALALGDAKPLASVDARVALILLLLVFGLVRQVSGPTSLVGVPVLCLLIWHAGPWIAFGGERPLETAWARGLAIGVVVLCFAIHGLYLLWRALRTDDDLLARFLGRGHDAASPDASARTEIQAIARAMHAAVAQLRGMRIRRRLLRLFENGRHLYELPWYLVIGGPGAGKTTALLNAGLRFSGIRHPGASESRGPTGTIRVAGPDIPAPTSQCDWWLGDQAVFLDTAGRYSMPAGTLPPDAAEWRGFMALLRKQRARAPVNGVVLMLDVAAVLSGTAESRMSQSMQWHRRLVELREELGIRFPVYVVVAKMDLLRGFSEYFQSLTSEGRTQVWGFTLPAGNGAGEASADGGEAPVEMQARVASECARLHQRLEDGLRVRLDEEFDPERRRRLFALPCEFAALAAPLAAMLDAIFADSRFDATQEHAMLRGVYFTSAAQAAVDLPAERGTLVRQLRRMADRSAGRTPAHDPAADAEGAVDTSPTLGRQGFFLHDLFARVVIPEAHLVRPNLRWEWRLRMLRFSGHALAITAGLWLALALAESFGRNRDYLDLVGRRADALHAQAVALFADFRPAAVPDVLAAGRELPAFPGLDPAHASRAPSGFSFGLYSAPPVVASAQAAYAQLQEHTMLAPILRRMEGVLTEDLADGNASHAFATLRAYKLLHDPVRYARPGGARDVRDWVIGDWARDDAAAAFGGRAAMRGHVDLLFSGARVVQAASRIDETLVRDVQRFLEGRTPMQRIYERAQAAMLPDTPQEFTLLRAVGPQAGIVFARAGGQSLERGVPGLFTRAGYRMMAGPRLASFVREALDDDGWVMGRVADTATAPGEAGDARLNRDAALVREIRRQYLSDYAKHWEVFLDSIRIVGHETVARDPASMQPTTAMATAGTGLGIDLEVLRQLAAPDSPLVRLARAAVSETTLGSPRVPPAGSLDRGLIGRAVDALGHRDAVAPDDPATQEEGVAALARQVVDSRFAALREVVTGSPESAIAADAAGPGTRSGLEALTGLFNEFYTLLVVADTSLAAGTVPPGAAEIGARLKLEATKLPAPLRAVLLDIAASGSGKVLQGATGLLHRQAQAQLDRLSGLMAAQVGEPCRRGIEGRYPMSTVGQDASIEDFSRVFAAGGAFDDYFGKYLAPFVDTGSRPWRYRSPESMAATGGSDTSAAVAMLAQPVATGPTLSGELLRLLARSGPDLDVFYRARQIRDAFFGEAEGRKFGWKLDLKVVELEPAITELVIDIDGQGLRYAHGPVQALGVAWPGPRGGATAAITAHPRVSAPTSDMLARGPWALFRLLERGRIAGTATPGRLSVEYAFDGRRALIEIVAGSQAGPLGGGLLRDFHCPGGAT